jgi:hypothetical protein
MQTEDDPYETVYLARVCLSEWSVRLEARGCPALLARESFGCGPQGQGAHASER